VCQGPDWSSQPLLPVPVFAHRPTRPFDLSPRVVPLLAERGQRDHFPFGRAERSRAGDPTGGSAGSRSQRCVLVVEGAGSIRRNAAQPVSLLSVSTLIGKVATLRAVCDVADAVVVGMGLHTELDASLTSLSGVLMGAQPLTETLTLVAGYAAQAIHGADGAGLTLVDSGRPDTVVASEDFVRVVDEVQYRLGEGPCLRAVEVGETQVCGSLAVDPRWPRFGPGAGSLGVNSALSLPLLVDGRVVGALNVYGHAHDAFDEMSVRAGELFASPAAVSVVNAQMLEATQRLTGQLEHALTSRTVIDQAIGILMSRNGGGAEEALDDLRTMSQTSDVKLTRVARLVVDQAVSRARARHASPPEHPHDLNPS
jgi:GAF domain-containing protein